MPAANSSSIEGVASKPVGSARGRANGTATPAAARGRAARPVPAEVVAEAAAAEAAAPAPVATTAKVGRGRPAGSKDRTPRTPKVPSGTASNGLNLRAIAGQVNAQIAEAKKNKRTAEAEYKAKDRELTAAMNAAIKAHTDAANKHEKAIKGFDAQIAAGEGLLAKLSD